MTDKYFGLIMAGGQGTRFWPYSTEKKPKQFLNIIGSQPLILQTFNRLKKFIKKGIDQYGSENLIIKPDCGFLPLKVFGEEDGYQIAIRKVKNMVLALNELK